MKKDLEIHYKFSVFVTRSFMLINATQKPILTASIELSKESKQMTRQYLANLTCSQNIEDLVQIGHTLLSKVWRVVKISYG
jgi:hypothetical protein